MKRVGQDCDITLDVLDVGADPLMDLQYCRSTLE